MLDAASNVVSKVLVISSSPCWISARSTSLSAGAGAPVKLRQGLAQVLVGAVKQTPGRPDIVRACGQQHGFLHRAAARFEMVGGRSFALVRNGSDDARRASAALSLVRLEFDHLARM